MIARTTSPKKILCVGLTGGIGSGKTTVATLFATLGVPVIDADVIAHDITKLNGPAYNPIVTHFGKSILHLDQTLNRQKLRQLIFDNVAERQWLEQLQHPIIRQCMLDQIARVTTLYCICVIPLLAESRGIDFIDRILVIDTSLNIQQQRAQTRDTAHAEAIQKIINTQARQATRLAIADDILVNSTATLSDLEKQVRQLHKRYVALARSQQMKHK